jgi:hypothetical protein
MCFGWSLGIRQVRRALPSGLTFVHAWRDGQVYVFPLKYVPIKWLAAVSLQVEPLIRDVVFLLVSYRLTIHPLLREEEAWAE